MSSIMVPEADGFVMVCVTKEGPNAVPLSMDMVTSDDTAIGMVSLTHSHIMCTKY